MALTACLVGGYATAHAAPLTATVQVDPDRIAAQGVNPAQQGFSFESQELVNPNFTSGALFNYLANLGQTGIVRIGGNSSDEQLWTTTGETFASVGGTWPINPSTNATIVQPANVLALSKAVHATGWKIIYGLDLKHDDAARAASEAQYVSAALKDSLVGLAIGNEANYYVSDGAAYYAEFAAYAAAIQALTPSAALIGSEMGSGAGIAGQQSFAYAFAKTLLPGIPAYDSAYDAAISAIVGNPGAAASEGGNTASSGADAAPPTPAGRSLLGSLRTFSAHYYPESACSAAGEPTSPSEMVSVATHAAVHGKVSWLAQEAQELGRPAVLDETNTVNCQGASGISNSYATALYSLDLLLTAAQAGIASVNLHSTIGPCGGTKAGDPGTTDAYYLYTPFCYATHDAEVAARSSPIPNLIAQPILFGAKAFRGLQAGQFVASSYSGPDSVRAYAILTAPHVLKIILIDTRDPATDPAPIDVALQLGWTGQRSSTVVLATADPKGLSSTDPSKITFGGAGIANTGSWSKLPLPSSFGTVGNGPLHTSLQAGTAQFITVSGR